MSITSRIPRVGVLLVVETAGVGQGVAIGTILSIEIL